jgi:enoyl-CoA hydratase
MNPSYENILVESPRADLTRIIVNRPQKLNSLNRATLVDVASCLDALPTGVRVLVLTGAGEKAFVAGADIAEMSTLSANEATAFSRLGHEVFARLESLDAVVIAEVNGYALGGGCEMMLACDFAIAAENAKIGQPEVQLGVTAGFGGTTRLLRRIGVARARQMLYTGEPVSANEAKSIGLVNEVVPATELRARVDAIAQKILSSGPLAVRASKRAVNLAAETDLSTANVYEQHAFGLCFATDDLREGMKAFLEKRRPVWTGK